MGTRHLTIVKYNKALFGQYGQWDGYPSGAGSDVLGFVEKGLAWPENILFLKHFENAKFLSEKEVERRWKEVGADGSGFVNMAVAGAFKAKHPQLNRDMGAGVLYYIKVTPQPELYNSIDFAADSLFCEYAWMLDFDREVFVGFKGFNETPLEPSDFFFYLEGQSRKANPNGKYHPIKQVCEFTFGDIQKRKVGLDNVFDAFGEGEDEDNGDGGALS